MRTFLRDILGALILAVLIFFLLQTTVQTSVVVGISMEPSFQEGQRLLVNKVVYNFYEPERGDVIVFHSPKNRQADYIKRIIALPGDTIEVKGGAVYVNGLPLDEPYIKEPPSYTFNRRKISEREYFVLGDNRNNSNDSHNNWIVSREAIIGKVWFKIWPAGEWGLVPNYPLEEQLGG